MANSQLFDMLKHIFNNFLIGGMVVCDGPTELDAGLQRYCTL